MTTDLPPSPELFPLDMLTHAVRNALNAPNGVIADWQCQPVYGGASAIFGGAIAGVYRITGHCRAGTELTLWSLILKVIGTTPQAPSPANAAYWRRELLVYQSALRDCLPSGLRMPRCFASTENETTAWMWLEDLGEMRANHWSLEQYASVAYLLGQFNGTFLVRQTVPQWEWLSHQGLRAWVEAAVPDAARLPTLHDNSLIQRWFPADDFDRIVRLWEQRDTLLQVVERLPHTLCHLDANRRNLVRRVDHTGAVTTTLIDWATCGIAALGEELAWLVWASYFLFEVDPAEVEQLEAATFNHYLAGLRDIGWQGDESEVRIGYAIGSAFRNATPLGITSVLEPEQQASIAAVSGRPIEQCLDRWAEVNHRVLNNLDALELFHH